MEVQQTVLWRVTYWHVQRKIKRHLLNIVEETIVARRRNQQSLVVGNFGRSNEHVGEPIGAVRSWIVVHLEELYSWKTQNLGQGMFYLLSPSRLIRLRFIRNSLGGKLDHHYKKITNDF